jgi:hypothetical protein
MAADQPQDAQDADSDEWMGPSWMWVPGDLDQTDQEDRP